MWQIWFLSFHLHSSTIVAQRESCALRYVNSGCISHIPPKSITTHLLEGAFFYAKNNAKYLCGFLVEIMFVFLLRPLYKHQFYCHLKWTGQLKGKSTLARITNNGSPRSNLPKKFPVIFWLFLLYQFHSKYANQFWKLWGAVYRSLRSVPPGLETWSLKKANCSKIIVDSEN